jgi:hypothetical protein
VESLHIVWNALPWMTFIIGTVIYGLCLIKIKGAFLPLTLTFVAGVVILIGVVVTKLVDDSLLFQGGVRHAFGWLWLLSGISWLLFIGKYDD